MSTHFIDLGKMKGWVDLGVTWWFWTQDKYLFLKRIYKFERWNQFSILDDLFWITIISFFFFLTEAEDFRPSTSSYLRKLTFLWLCVVLAIPEFLHHLIRYHIHPCHCLYFHFWLLYLRTTREYKLEVNFVFQFACFELMT